MTEEQVGYCMAKKSGQIPAFGNWESVNDMPITQYFECARQAGGLFPYSNSSGECAADLYAASRDDLYALNFNKPPPEKQNQKTRGGSIKGCHHVKDQNRNQVKKKKQAGDMKEPPRKQLQHHQHQRPLPKHSQKTASNNKIACREQTKTITTTTVVRAVDEDLYKIPPELLHSSKRKRRLGFFSRCLVPACMV